MEEQEIIRRAKIVFSFIGIVLLILVAVVYYGK